MVPAVRPVTTKLLAVAGSVVPTTTPLFKMLKPVAPLLAGTVQFKVIDVDVIAVAGAATGDKAKVVDVTGAEEVDARPGGFPEGQLAVDLDRAPVAIADLLQGAEDLGKFDAPAAKPPAMRFAEVDMAKRRAAIRQKHSSSLRR